MLEHSEEWGGPRARLDADKLRGWGDPQARNEDDLAGGNRYDIRKGRVRMMPVEGRKTWLGLIVGYIATLLVVSLSVAVAAEWSVRIKKAEWRTSESVLALAGDRTTANGAVILSNPVTGQILGSSSAKRWDANGFGAYAATKEAIRALSRAAACEWGPEGIRTNVILPHAKSPGLAWWMDNHPEEAEAFIAGIPQRRVGECEEDIGRFVVLLCSDAAGYINGQSIGVDGGQALIG